MIFCGKIGSKQLHKSDISKEENSMYIVENWQYINGYYRRITRKFEVEADAMTAYNNTRAGGITNPTVLYKEQKDYLVKICNK